MVRSEQESPVPEIGTPGLMWRGLETGPWGPYTGTKLETAETAKGNLPVPRLSSTLLLGEAVETSASFEARTAPLPYPTHVNRPERTCSDATSWTG